MRIQLVAGLLCCTACSAVPSDLPASQSQPVIYDDDGRKEPYELDDPRVRALVARSVVALLPKSAIHPATSALRSDAPLRSDIDDTACSGERFFDQPAAAVCSGVLVDWDLVLTAAHCTRALPLADLIVVFGYYYRAPAELALSREGAFEVDEIVLRRVTLEGELATRDYAWLRLARRAAAPYQPVAIRISDTARRAGSSILYAGAYEGSPLKVDQGARVREAGPSRPYFVADTDSAHGGSGGGAFDADLSLLGTLFRGGADRVAGETCSAVRRVSSDLAEERFASASAALADLCEQDPSASSLCRRDCLDPCEALPPRADGCALALGERATSGPASGLYALLFLLSVRIRARRDHRTRAVS